MKEDQYKGVFVFAQQVDNQLEEVALELLGKGKELAADLGCGLTAVLLGDQVEELCDKLASYGADRVILVEDPALHVYMTEPYAHVLAEVVKKYQPEILLYGATAIGRDLAPRVSARVHTGLTADCTALEIDQESGLLLMTRPAFGGNIMAAIICAEHRPQMATVRPGVMVKSKSGTSSCVMEKFLVDDLGSHVNVEILEIVAKKSNKVNIQDANILISGGRGVKDQEGFAMLEELAVKIGGTVSASRAAVEAGLADKAVQVGQTGKTVRPNLYIACGISGAIQHVAGMEEADVIVAINSDPAAPIFEIADFGLVGDVKKILPAVTAMLTP